MNRAPIIVLGNQKSGTTAVAAMLAHYAGVSVTLDIPALWGAVEMDVRDGRRSFASLVMHNRIAFRRDVVKEPYLSFMDRAVRETFPAARFVTVVRDPRDNIRSVLNRLALRGDQEHILSEPMPDRWKCWFDPRAVNAPGAGYIEVAASRWNIAADTYLEHSDETVLARYEDFIADKKGFIARLASALGLPQARELDPLLDVQFQPRGQPTVDWLGFFGACNLERIETLCASRMQRLHYPHHRLGS